MSVADSGSMFVTYLPQVSASSNDERLRYDVILVSLGARYNMYCANLARTLLVDPSKQQEAEYQCDLDLAVLYEIDCAPRCMPVMHAAHGLDT